MLNLPTLQRCLLAAALILASAAAQPAAVVVILDVSESSPLLANEDFTHSAAGAVAEKIGRLPVGSKVRSFVAGDNRLQAPLAVNEDIQRIATRRGYTARTLSQVFGRKLVDQVAEFKLRRAHRQSELTTAVLDASRLCVDHQALKAGRSRADDCEIVFLTDGAEFVGNGIQYPRDAPKKPLPPVTGLDLKGVRITLIGVGQGVDGATGQLLSARWDKFLRDAGASQVVLRRV
jgi:hypothetical protein